MQGDGFALDVASPPPTPRRRRFDDRLSDNGSMSDISRPPSTQPLPQLPETSSPEPTIRLIDFSSIPST